MLPPSFVARGKKASISGLNFLEASQSARNRSLANVDTLKHEKRASSGSLCFMVRNGTVEHLPDSCFQSPQNSATCTTWSVTLNNLITPKASRTRLLGAIVFKRQPKLDDAKAQLIRLDFKEQERS